MADNTLYFGDNLDIREARRREQVFQ